MKKRILGILLALCMTLTLLPTTAFAGTEAAGFNLNGSNLSVASGTFTVDNGTATISIGGSPYSGSESNFTNVDLTSEIIITLNAAPNYTGSLIFDGKPLAESYCQRNGQAAVYTFKLADLNVATGEGKSFGIEFQNAQTPPVSGTAGFNLSGTNLSVTSGTFTVDNGTATISIGGSPYTGSESNFTNVDLTSEIIITLNAAENYTGSLGFDGKTLAESYCQRNGQTAVYTFKLSDLSVANGDGKTFNIEFQNGQIPPPPAQDTPIPSDSILLSLSDNLGNSQSYDMYHNDPRLGVTIEYSYDNTTWNELSNHTADANCTQAYDSTVNNGTYIYAFTNEAQVFIRVTAVTGTGGMIQSKALAGYDDGKTIWPGAVTLNQSYTLNKKDGSIYDLEFNNGKFTVIWSYDAGAQDSLRVDHGTVAITKIDNVDTVSDPANGIGNTATGGFWMIKAGAEVELTLKPDYGYQFLSGGFNDATMVSGSGTSTFTFTMASTPLHFHALFQKVDNKVNAESQKVQSGNIEISDQEIDSGTVELSVGDITLTPDQITNFETAANGYNISSYLDINLDQVLYKGSATDVWTNELKELNNPATVTLQLEEGVDGNEIVIVHEKHDGTYEIIPTTYDAATRTISFTTTSFSNYAIASKTVATGHTHTLTHITAKAATATTAGNKEYWHCSECGKYFSDASGNNEITLASTVIASTGTNSNTTNPQTGDNSNMMLWICLLFVSGGVLTALGIVSKKRKKYMEE